jgi:hypothetical protein
MRRSHLVLVTAALALGACSKGGAGGGGGAQRAATAAGIGGGCSGYQAGSNGVIRTFCDGPGAVTVTLNGASRTLKGGSCEQAGPMFSFNLGVVTGAGAPKPYPDYVGLTAQGAGKFSNAVLVLHLDGKSYLVSPNTGEADAKGGSFSGVARTAGAPDVQVSGTFTC